MSDVKTIEDFEHRADWLLRVLVSSRIKIEVDNSNKLTFKYDKSDIQWLAGELLTAYTDGVNDKCAELL